MDFLWLSWLISHAGNVYSTLHILPGNLSILRKQCSVTAAQIASVFMFEFILFKYIIIVCTPSSLEKESENEKWFLGVISNNWGGYLPQKGLNSERTIQVHFSAYKLLLLIYNFFLYVTRVRPQPSQLLVFSGFSWCELV